MDENKAKPWFLSYPGKILLDLLIVGVVLGIADGVVRQLYQAELKAWSAPLPEKHQGSLLLKGNPYLIFEYAPGVKLENGIELRINRLGLRGQEIKLPKPEKVRRLMTIGDSAIFGFGVAEDMVFSQVAADALGEDVEAINGAIPGYSTYQSINLLRLRGWQTDPDVLVIGNLWSDNNFGNFVDKELIATMTGFEESFMARLHRMLSFSAMYRVADWNNRVRDRAAKIKQVGQDISKGTQTGYRRVAINDYANNLDTLVRAAKARDAEVVFLMLANEEDVKGTAKSFAWSSYRQVMRDTASRHGAPLLDGVSLFKQSGLGSRDLFVDKMHPSVQGHRLLGKKLAEILQHWKQGAKLMSSGDGKARQKYSDRFQKEKPKSTTKKAVVAQQSTKTTKQSTTASSPYSQKNTSSANRSVQPTGPKPIALAPPLEAELSEIDQKTDEALMVGTTPEQPFQVIIGHALTSVYLPVIDRRLAQDIRDSRRDLAYRLVLMHIIARRSQPSSEQVLIETLSSAELRAMGAYLLGRIGTPGYPGKIRNRSAVLAALQKHVQSTGNFTDPWHKKTIPIADYVIAACIRISQPESGSTIGFTLPQLSAAERQRLQAKCQQVKPAQ